MRSRRVSSAYLTAAEALRPNAGQWAAYESRGHCAVLAGPGSGKTKTLTVKLARMLAEDVNTPASVACITYSQETVRELDARLNRLGVRDAPGLFVGTVHAFCLRHLLAPYARLAGLSIPWPLVVATSAQANAAFSRAVSRIYGQGRGPYTAFDVGRMRRAHVDDPAAMDAADSDLARLVHAYKAELLAAGVIDFDDVMLFGYRLVCDYEWVLRAVQAKLPILAIDEYQDLGVPLDRIVRRLAFGGGVRLFAVGDGDQSVYGFAGADGSLLTEMSDRVDVETVRLELNYRSAGGIVRMSELALGEVRGYVASDKGRVATIKVHQCSGGQGEQGQRLVTELIPQALAAKPGRTLGDIAVLYRAATLGTVVAAELDKANIGYIRSDAAAPYKRTAATSWLEDLAAWCVGGWRVGSPSLEALCRRYASLQSKGYSDMARRAFVQRLTTFLWTSRDGSASALPFMSRAIGEFLTPVLDTNPSLADQREQVRRMLAALGPGGILEGATVARMGCRDGSPDRVNLVTMHSAKGCEYDVVLMVGLDQGTFPWSNESAASVSEGRRLFYVGLTRARDEVHMLYTGWYEHRGQRRALGPSIYLVELAQRMRSQSGT